MGLEHEGRVVLHLRAIPVTVPREGHGQARPIPVPRGHGGVDNQETVRVQSPSPGH